MPALTPQQAFETIQQLARAVADALDASQDDFALTGHSDPDPTQDDLDVQEYALAVTLWKADPARTGPARTFHDDYASTQDRYLTMARAALNPTPEDHQ